MALDAVRDGLVNRDTVRGCPQRQASHSLIPSIPLQIRFLVILREPISRAYSHWQHEHRRGKDVPSNFAEAVHDELLVSCWGESGVAKEYQPTFSLQILAECRKDDAATFKAHYGRPGANGSLPEVKKEDKSREGG